MTAMKTAPKTAEAAAPAAAPKASLFKSKKFLIAVVLLLVVAGVAYKILAPTPPPGPAVGGDVVTLDPTTLNLTGGHYLKIGVAIQLVQGKATKTDFEVSQAQEIVIDQFTNRSVASLTNPTRHALVAGLAKRLEKAYEGKVFTVYLTQFVTQ